MKKIIENNKCLYFLKELLKYKKEIGILSISTIVSTVTVFLQPLLIKQITDIGILEKNMPQIVNGVAGLFVCVLVYLMIEVVQKLLQKNIIHSIRTCIAMYFENYCI